MDASGNLTTVYTNGANGLLSKRVGSTSTYYMYDPQGSVAARLNASTVVSSDLYDAYGQLRGAMQLKGIPPSERCGDAIRDERMECLSSSADESLEFIRQCTKGRISCL
jgi:hypothetical protein